MADDYVHPDIDIYKMREVYYEALNIYPAATGDMAGFRAIAVMLSPLMNAADSDTETTDQPNKAAKSKLGQAPQTNTETCGGCGEALHYGKCDTESSKEAVQKIVDYLYKIEESEVIGKISPEMFQAISTLRQLINEEFVAKDRQVSSQLIYDIITRGLSSQIVRELEEIRRKFLEEDTFYSLLIEDRINTLRETEE